MESLKKKEKVRIFSEIFKTLGWCLDVLKQYKIRLYLYIICLVLQSVYQIYMTSKVGNLVDLALDYNVTELAKIGAFFAFLFATNIIITIACNRFASYNYNGMYNDLEMKVYRKIMDASWEGLTEYHSGDIITRLSSDIKTVAGNSSGLVPTMVSKLTLICGAACFIVYLDYTMVLLAAVIAPVILIASRVFLGKIYECEKKSRQIESKINSCNVETFNNIQSVKAFGIGDQFYDQMYDLEIARKKVELNNNKYIMFSYATTYGAGIVGACILAVWMFHRVREGVVSFGEVSVITFLAVQISQAAETLVQLIPTIMAYMASAERIKKLLIIPDEDITDSADIMENFISEQTDDGISVHVEDMYFKYKNGHSIFEGVDFEASCGEIVAIVGPSGEGKTTLLRILLGIVQAYKGKVFVDNGKQKYDLGTQTRPLISYVPQGNALISGTILDNLKMVNRDATDEMINKALETACVKDFINSIPEGLEYKVGQDGIGLSEGQKQRICIARTILKNSPILLLDEATSALDVATERKVLFNIKESNPDKTIIITTHRPTVLSMCKRVYRIADKKVQIIGQDEIQKLMDEF